MGSAYAILGPFFNVVFDIFTLPLNFSKNLQVQQPIVHTSLLLFGIEEQKCLKCLIFVKPMLEMANVSVLVRSNEFIYLIYNTYFLTISYFTTFYHKLVISISIFLLDSFILYVCSMYNRLYTYKRIIHLHLHVLYNVYGDDYIFR
ncbi:hypothetical protein ACJX0J_010620 [Zea mays]